MHPLARTCGWCGTTTVDAALTHCLSCGGPLPAPRMDEAGVAALGPAPPPAPRALPPAFRRQVLVWQNVLVIIGGVFTFVFFWTGVFLLIGAPMLYVGWTRAQRRLQALETGLPVVGEVVEVDRDHTVRINGRSPWRLRFTWEGEDGAREAWVHAWRAPALRPGDPTWVVVDPTDPAQACLWPPVR